MSGLLEMYKDPDDFFQQLSIWYGLLRHSYMGDTNSLVIEPGHEISIGDKKAQRLIGRLGATGEKLLILRMREKLGGQLIGVNEVRNGGRQVWTAVPASSGFYVLAYFAPEENYGKYEKYYDQMVSSFAPKDGPGGAGSIKPDETALKKEQSESQWKNLLDIFKSKRDTLFSGPATKDVPDIDYGGTRKKTVSSGWFVDTSSQKEIIDFASTMKPTPTIPEGAKRNFVKANTFLKDAKNASDYKYAIDAYEEALLDAPWWGNAYYNLGIALAGAGWYDDAKESINLYLLTNPSEADKNQAQNKIYEIEAQQELQEKRNAAMKAKYGGRQGGSYGWEDLFRYGAVVQDMRFDASGNERTISLKIVTRKESGFLRTYFQIADITSRNDTFLQKFSIDWRGTNTFYLDDRTYPNKELMTLTVTSYGDGDANITIRPANHASASIKTSLTALLRELASQAVYAGDKINIGGRDFYVLGQGGAKGSLLFFPPEIKDQIESGTARDLMPALVAIVNYRGSDGSNQSYTNTDLGEVNGTHYHLEFTGSYWEAKVGRGEEH